jgi:hypothetical protein
MREVDERRVARRIRIARRWRRRWEVVVEQGRAAGAWIVSRAAED